jgi:oligopeptide transport system substrate-binding protein
VLRSLRTLRLWSVCAAVALALTSCAGAGAPSASSSGSSEEGAEAPGEESGGPGEAGGGTDKTGNADEPAGGEGAGTTGDGAETPSDVEAGAGGEPGQDVLRVAVQEPTTLDPMLIQDPGSVLVVRQLFESLTRWNDHEQKVVPAAAASWDERKQGRRFVFRLRRGMTFHDGSPVTAKDFRFAFDRIARKKSASEVAYTLELVRGFTAVNGFGSARHLSGITVTGPRTLVIELREPFRDFPAVLTHPALAPVPREAVDDRKKWLRKPVGNGPFEMTQRWALGQPITLGRFGGGPQTTGLAGISFVPYADAGASWLEFIKGDLDIAEVPAGEIETAEEVFGDEGFQPLLAGYYFGFNTKTKALKSLRLRKAISRAIDRTAIARGIYDRSLQEPRGIVPAGMPGFVKDACGSLCDYAPKAARRTIRRLPLGRRRVTLEYTRGSPHGRVARAVRGDLKSAGLKVKLKAFAFPKYLRRLQDGKQSMFRLGWIAEYPVPDVFLSSLFESGSPDNHSGIRSRTVDRLLARAHRAPSRTGRLKLYRRAEKKIMSLVPVVPVGSFVTRWATQERVRGIQFDVMGGFDAARVSLD